MANNDKWNAISLLLAFGLLAARRTENGAWVEDILLFPVGASVRDYARVTIVRECSSRESTPRDQFLHHRSFLPERALKRKSRHYKTYY